MVLKPLLSAATSFVGSVVAITVDAISTMLRGTADQSTGYAASNSTDRRSFPAATNNATNHCTTTGAYGCALFSRGARRKSANNCAYQYELPHHLAISPGLRIRRYIYNI